MARQQTRFNPAEKEFEAYLDFSGGHNSEVGNERLNDNEFPQMINVDNSGRGSAKMRYGRTEHAASPGKFGFVTSSTKAQGIFSFYKAPGLSSMPPDIIMAIDGYLYVSTQFTSTCTKIPITDGANTDFRFQQTLPIEATQYQNNLFIATGTKLVELTFDATQGSYTAKTVTPYTPTAMEAIYIGTNGLADNPDAYIQDGVASGSIVEAVGIKPQYRNGAVNAKITMTAYVNKPSSYSGAVDYQWEYKKSSETTWPGTPYKAFTSGLKSVDFTFDTPTKYDIRVTVRKAGVTADKSEYILSSFTVNSTPLPPTMPVNGIQTCRKIFLHWDRILMCGDDKNPYQMYISDLQNPRYFPVSNTINFDFGKQEPITAVVRFQDMLVIFTKSTIQTLVGKSTDDYKRYMIHDGLGCIAGRSAVVVGNNVVFLSLDGIYALRPNPYRLETMNVARIDHAIQREIGSITGAPAAADACAIAYDSQYWLCLPSKKTIYRYYFERKTWVKDMSDGLDIAQFLQNDDDVYNMTRNGRLLLHDRTAFTDNGAVYTMTIESKFYDLSASFNNKKLKRLYLLGKHYVNYDVEMSVTVKADSATVLTPETGGIVTDEPGGWRWDTTQKPNMEFLRGTAFGSWVLGESAFGDIELSVQRASIRGKCRRVKVIMQAQSTTPCEIYGFALEFKLKKI